MSKQILLIVANPATSTTLGIPVGFWAAELIHPYDAFVNAGCQVMIASPKQNSGLETAKLVLESLGIKV